MERLKRSFRNSFRRKKSIHETASSKPYQWEGDEAAVRNGNCVFHVKYLGCIQVQDSRGMHICEQALIALKSQKGKSIKGQLYVSGDGLRVVDDETKGLIVDQTIEKVSFCAPDRNHDRGFSYICRDGTTRRWMCHGFIATKETGDRLSHAVGCSFGVCLERKQKRDAKLLEMKATTTTGTAVNNISLNSVGSSVNCNSSANSDLDNTTAGKFSRTGSFRRIPLKQRMKDPQEAKLIEPLPVKEVHNPFAIERPHATPQLLERQGSCRIFGGLNQNSPFKRQLSLRYATPREMERNRRNSLQQQQQQDDSLFNKFGSPFNRFENSTGSSPAADHSTGGQRTADSGFVANFSGQPEDRKENADLSAMCKYMTENLTMLSNKPDLFGDSSFQQFDSFTSSKSPTIAKGNQSLSSITPNTPDSFVNSSSIQHKTLISVEPNSLFKSHHSSSKSSTPNFETKEKLKFGQLSSYSDDFFFQDALSKSLGNSTGKSASPSNVSSTIAPPSNDKPSSNGGVMFTDLDGPLFEVNFDCENVTKINVDSGEPSSLSVNNSSMNSLSNSVTGSLNGDRTASDYLVGEMNSVNNNLSNMRNNLSNSLSNSGKNVNQNSAAHNGAIHPISSNQSNHSVSSLNRKNNLNNNILSKKSNENKKEIYDPFSSEWVSNLTKNDHRSTNPFLQNLGTTQVFELKM